MDKKAAYRQGVIVGVGLLVLTLIEFFISQAEITSLSIFLIISLIKSAIVVQFFMHIYRLWREESH